MNKSYLLVLTFFVSVFSYSQEDTTREKKIILASLSFEMGPMMDQYQKVDLDMMYDLTSNPSAIERDLTGHEATFDSRLEGSKLGASIALIPFSKKKNDYSDISEIRIGLFYKVRGARLSYLLTNSSGAYKSVDYSARFKELSLHGAYVWKYNPKFAKRFTLSAGLGIGVGTTFGDKTSVGEIISSGQANEIPNSIFETYEGNSSLFARAFVPIGLDYALSERFDVGIQSNIGTGMQKVYNGGNHMIQLSGSVSFKATYFF